MILRKLWTVVLAFALIFSLAACGESKGNTTATSEGESVSTEALQEVVDKLAEEAQAVPQPDTKIAEADSATGEASLDTVEDKLLGDWVDINAADRVVNITKNGDQYQYKDSDGAYAGTFKDGVLTIKISDAENDTAKVFIDSKTGNMVTDYQGDIYEFTRKVN